ncbi:uncharacterized protein MAM_05040 [Metarhizium album ARSEF 1941]|uniref:Uncharacterized protein n=1 Tax=Metarhizium album (strain ARSEF 1941) TaxID=1081103 RepID=A0A0B2WLJ2_METAS|nr:uncharacterized protein MAM_05040 [Metarhizium album ARSEF 1941]KHN96931.1 hypothetical protein MAM_05040 [Metarhizium album ARSEF 1941]
MDVQTKDEQHPSVAVEDENAGYSSPSDEGDPISPHRRLATIYDAVAGRVTKDTALRNERSDQNNSYRRSHQRQEQQPRVTRHPTHGTPIAPDEVLFRRKEAPVRYVEHDVYNAHERDLPQGGRDILPDSDLLKSVHAYASKFYGAMERRRSEMNQGAEAGAGNSSSIMGKRGVDEQSLDETALLAFGILLEEASREILGQRGDLVFTEGIVGADASSGDEGAQRAESTVGYHDVRSSLAMATSDYNSVAGRRLAKRRRLADSG